MEKKLKKCHHLDKVNVPIAKQTRILNTTMMMSENLRVLFFKTSFGMRVHLKRKGKYCQIPKLFFTLWWRHNLWIKRKRSRKKCVATFSSSRQQILFFNIFFFLPFLFSYKNKPQGPQSSILCLFVVRSMVIDLFISQLKIFVIKWFKAAMSRIN